MSRLLRARGPLFDTTPIVQYHDDHTKTMAELSINGLLLSPQINDELSAHHVAGCEASVLVDLAWRQIIGRSKRGKKRRNPSAAVAGIKFIDLALPSNL